MLENLSPKSVFHFFEDICSIPHGSGNTDAISDYCVRFATERGLECVKDSLNNVIIKKAAAVGYENHPTVILQGHMDMVCEKHPDSDFDFTKDGLRLRVDGDMLSADGTTLGADDGIAVAMILALLDDESAEHPSIEALLTVDEETGMYGAEGVDMSLLTGSTLINLDSGEEGVLTAGCAGGAKVDMRMLLSSVPNSIPCKRISLTGLCGGHSGIDINKGRLNADKMLGKFLAQLPYKYRLVSVNGGFKDNVIPNACECVIACDRDISSSASEFVRSNRAPSDPDLSINVTDVACAKTCFDDGSTARVIEFLNTVPFGVIKMSNEIDGHVQSSQNLGIVSTDSDSFTAVMSVRSSVASEKQQMLDGLEKLACSLKADYSTHGHYPAWEYRTDSRLRGIMTDVYKKMFGKAPVTETVHAGLECGLFSEKIKNFDAVSMGPDMWDIHTVNEHLSISSTKRTYEYLCAVLKEL